MRRITPLLLKQIFLMLSCLLLIGTANAQVLDPNDPLVRFPNSPQPNRWNIQRGAVGKWGATRVVNWNSDSYKAYIYRGVQDRFLAFRLRFPNDYDINRAEKYPIIIMCHGLGERGNIDNNERQLTHGAQQHMNAANAGRYDGFLLFPQTTSTYALNDDRVNLAGLISYLINHANIDPNRIVLHGISGGAKEGVWRMVQEYPTIFAAILPMSGVDPLGGANLNIYRFTPIWLFQGDLDRNPTPQAAQSLTNTILQNGGNIRYTLYANTGHGTWGTAYNEADFFPFILQSNKVNPWVLFGKNEFCIGEPISATIGVSQGFDGYEWRKDGVLISGATSNTISITETGSYSVRVRRGSTWTYWSPTPAVIRVRPPTEPVSIEAIGSTVLPSLDGKTTTTLRAPDGYQSYLWSTGATTQSIVVSTQGSYSVSVTEPGGCPSDMSAPLFVRVGNVAGAPLAPTGFTAEGVSETSISLNWIDQANNETMYEVYRSLQPTSDFLLVAKLPANATTFEDTNLDIDKEYFYRIRAINQFGGSIGVNATASTKADKIAPTIPQNLRMFSSSQTSITIQWDPSTDNVGVTQYEVYMNGSLRGVLPGNTTSFEALSLTPMQLYTFRVRARDASANFSPFSNQISVPGINSGLHYSYYEGTFSNLSQLTPATLIKTGRSSNVTLDPRNRTTNFGFVWEGFINIPEGGVWQFFTRSDDGSALFINGTQVVANDFNQGMTERAGTITLTPGAHQIRITYRQATGGFGMEVRWQGPGVPKDLIPDWAFVDEFTAPAKPAFPTNLTASAISHNKIALTWQDNSSDETGFELYRATDNDGPFLLAATLAANTTSFTDTNLAAGTRYFYRVQAINANGASNDSGEIPTGVAYQFFQGDFTNLNQLATATPVSTGRTPNFDLTPRGEVATHFAFRWTGSIQIRQAGTYRFFTRSDDGSRLSINGVGVVTTNDRDQTMTERSGTIALTPGEHQIEVLFRQRVNTFGLEVRYELTGQIVKQLIPSSVLKGTQVNATTHPLPAAPAVPTALSATATANSVTLSWTDNANNEEGYQIWRALGTSTNFSLVAELPENSTSYTNTGLAPHTAYTFRVLAVNAGGASAPLQGAFSTLNTNPVLQAVGNHTARFGALYEIPLFATDADQDNLTFSAAGLPAFAVLTNLPENRGRIVVNATLAHVGVYSGIVITVTDAFGGTASETITLTISDNFPPVITSPGNLSVPEGVVTNITLTATDQDAADVLTWSAANLPAFVTLVPGAGRTAILRIAPDFYSEGTYTGLRVTVTDNKGSSQTIELSVEVIDTDPNATVFVNFNGAGQPNAPAPWNNTATNPTAGATFSNLLDETGNNSGLSIRLLNAWGGAWNAGATSPTGAVPPVVSQHYYWFGIFGAANTVQFRVSGMNPDKVYKFRFFASSVFRNGGVTDNGSTVYTIGSQSVTLRAEGNISNFGEIANIQGDANGEIIVTVTKSALNVEPSGGYLNALIIESRFNDNTPPQAPTNLSASVTPAHNVSLTWTDKAINETGYEVWRSTGDNLNFVLIATTPANTIAYTDNTAFGTTAYFYRVRAINGNGVSDFSRTVNVVTPNFPPVLTGVQDVWIKEGRNFTMNIGILDNADDNVEVSVENLPTSFASFSMIDPSNMQIRFRPRQEHIGSYKNVRITATDNKGATVSRTFDIYVRNRNVDYVHVNFNTADPASFPWNNFNSVPAPNVTLSNLLNDSNQPTPIAVTLIDPWTSGNGHNAVLAEQGFTGQIFGDNSGALPDQVMRSYYFDGSTERRIRVSGLDPARRYNFSFMSSFVGLNYNETIFTINGQSASVQATGNTHDMARLNGIQPAADGTVLISVSRAMNVPFNEFAANNSVSRTYTVNSLFAILNAMIIEQFTDNGVPVVPTGVKAAAWTTTSVELTWEDNSFNETGFEIYRANGSTSSGYTLVATTPANTRRFMDVNLQASTPYYYQVRAISGPNASAMSNVAQATTPQQLIYVNYGPGTPPSLWNSASRTSGLTNIVNTRQIVNLRDQAGVSTTMELFIDNTGEAGQNPFGYVTGNNSGIFPDIISDTFWFLEANNTAQLSFRNVNPTFAYNLIFFNSTSFQIGSNSTVEYTSGGKSVSLYPWANTSRVARIDGIQPENGRVTFSFRGGRIGGYGYVNATVLQAYLPALAENAGARMARITEQNQPAAPANAVAEEVQAIEKESILEVYPNPFSHQFNVGISLRQAGRVAFTLMDVTGKVIFSSAQDMKAGYNTATVDLQYRQLASGLYFLRTDSHEHAGKVLRIVKE